MNHRFNFHTCIATLLALAVLGATVACIVPEREHRGGDEGGHGFEHEHEHEHEHGPDHPM
jgi:hypothetical protein